MILVTGGAGYIGPIVIKELLDHGYAVRVLDTLYFGELGLAPMRDRIDLVQGDIRNLPTGIFDNIEAVIHLAGLSNDPMAEFNPKLNYDINTEGTKLLAEACKEHGVKRFSFASTCSIYDTYDSGLEDLEIMQYEESSVSPKAAYAKSNYDAERILLEMYDKDFSPVILRQGTVYGWSPRMRFDLVVNTMVRDAHVHKVMNVHRGGTMWRPLASIADIAKAHFLAVAAPDDKVAGQIFNVVHDNFRILDLAHIIRHNIPAFSDIDIKVSYDMSKRVRSYRVSGQKICGVLGFTPTDSPGHAANMIYSNTQGWSLDEWLHPSRYNIEWMRILSEVERLKNKDISILQ